MGALLLSCRGHLKTRFHALANVLYPLSDDLCVASKQRLLPHDGADDGAVWMQGGAQALGQGLGQAEDVGGNGGGADGGGGESAGAVCGVDVGVRQVGTGDVVEAVVFVQREFGVGGLHGGDVTECADDGQVVRAVAAQGGVSLWLFKGVV